MSEKTYLVGYSCGNCGRRHQKAIDFGVIAPQVISCPGCGNQTAVRDGASYVLPPRSTRESLWHKDIGPPLVT